MLLFCLCPDKKVNTYRLVFVLYDLTMQLGTLEIKAQSICE